MNINITFIIIDIIFKLSRFIAIFQTVISFDQRLTFAADFMEQFAADFHETLLQANSKATR